MKIKLKKLFIISIFSTLLVSCSFFESKIYHLENSHALTVTNIHDSIVLGKTTKKDLVKQFGEPNSKIQGSSKVEELADEDNNREGSTFDLLDEYTDYYDTKKYKTTTYSDGPTYDSCYIYQGDNLGLEYVRFFMKDNKVRYYFYGDITDESVAKKDKYLRQILD